MPVARGDLRQQREHGVAEVAAARDQLPGAAADQPVRLRVVDLAAHDRPEDPLELVGVHLVVARHHRRHVDPLGERPLVAGDDRRADAAVALVDDHLDRGSATARAPLGGRVARGVVDDDDPVDEVRDPGDVAAISASSL